MSRTGRPRKQVVNEAVKEFTAAHAGVKVDDQPTSPTNTARHEKFKGAFNDPASAPDVAEYGNTDLADYVAAGGLADLTADLTEWAEATDLPADLLEHRAASTASATACPWYIGVRALYYRTDVFTELELKPPTSLRRADRRRAKRSARRNPTCSASRSAASTRSAPCPSSGTPAATSPPIGPGPRPSTPRSQEGVKAYTDLLRPTSARRSPAPTLTGGKTVELSPAARPAWASSATSTARRGGRRARPRANTPSCRCRARAGARSRRPSPGATTSAS